MAFISNTMFWPCGDNGSNENQTSITGIFNNSDAQEEICSAGFLCKRSSLLDCEGYASAGIKNTNSWKMVAAVSTDTVNEPIYACFPCGVNEITDPITGATYKVGPNTLGIPLPKGVRGTFRQIKFDNVSRYEFGVGNTSGTIGTNQYFTIDSGLIKTAASAPTTAGTPYFKIIKSEACIAGAYNQFTKYVVVACVA